jgi:hypothetical protein
MKSLTEIIVFLEDVLGKDAAQLFDEHMDEFIYYVRFNALSTPDLADRKMRIRLRKLAEGIIAAALKRFLEDNYANDTGELNLNINDTGVYDNNMQPISAVDKIKKTQREMVSLIVSSGMDEFIRGKTLAKSIISRARRYQEEKPSQKDATWQLPAPPINRAALEQVEIQIMRLERKLPAIDEEGARLLAALYSQARTMRAVKSGS